MSALHDGDWEAAEASSPSHRSHASGLVAAHLQWHLERQLRTPPLVGGSTGSPPTAVRCCSGRMCAMAMNRVSSSWRG